MPTVSVVIPTYNRALMVKEAIQSVLDQTYSDFEIIVVDDGSTDDTREVVTAFADKVRYVFQENSGRSNARNRAIHMARGRYIAFLDSDDLYMPHKLDMQVACMEKVPEFGMVYSTAVCIDEQGNDLTRIYKANESGWIYRLVAFYKPLTIILPSVMIRADALYQVGGFDESLDRFEDTDMFRRVSRKYPIKAISEPLCKIRTHSDNSLTNQDPEEILRALTYYVDKAFNEDRDVGTVFLRKGAARMYTRYAIAILQHPQWRGIGHKIMIQSIKYWPFQVTAYCYLLPSSTLRLLLAFWGILKRAIAPRGQI